ncbi:MAG: TIR domain-containing protein, partial [Verrucomicrobiota bacterium]
MARPRVFVCATQTDRAAARLLERALRSFRAPKSLELEPHRRPFLKAQFWTHERENSREKLVPESVLEPVRESGAMVVLCSPSANVSKWVRMEIAAFTEV